MIAELCVTIDLAQLTRNFDRHYILYIKKLKGKVIYNTRDVKARVNISAATALERGRVTSPMLGCLYSGKFPILIFRRLSGLQENLDTKQ